MVVVQAKGPTTMTTYTRCDVPGCDHEETYDAHREPERRVMRVSLQFGHRVVFERDLCPRHRGGVEHRITKAIDTLVPESLEAKS
jgi:hypothetical protein